MLLTTDGVVVSVTTALVAARLVTVTANSDRKANNNQSRPANRRRNPPGHMAGAVADKGKFIQR
jgi:hypothetical protein